MIAATNTTLVAININLVNEIGILKGELSKERQNHAGLLHAEKDVKDYWKGRSATLTNQLGKAIVDCGKRHSFIFF